MMFEVHIGREDCPTSPERNDTNKGVDNRYSYTPTLTLIAGLRGSFVVRSFDGHVRKGAKRCTKALKLRLGSNPG